MGVTTGRAYMFHVSLHWGSIDYIQLVPLIRLLVSMLTRPSNRPSPHGAGTLWYIISRHSPFLQLVLFILSCFGRVVRRRGSMVTGSELGPPSTHGSYSSGGAIRVGRVMSIGRCYVCDVSYGSNSGRLK